MHLANPETRAVPFDLAMDDRERPEFTLVHLGQARIFNEDVICSVPSSQEGGIDIKVGSSTMHMPKHCSEHHPVVQIVLFPIEHVSQDTFCCPHIMVPKVIRDTIEKARIFNEDVKFSVPSSQEGGIDTKVGSSAMHMLKHCSEHHPVVQIVQFPIEHVSQDTFCYPHTMVPKVIRDTIEKASLSEGAPPNSNGYGHSKMYALGLPPSLRTRDEGTFYLDSGATLHMVSDNTNLINLRNPPAETLVTVADGSEYPVTKVGDIHRRYIKIEDVNVVPGLQMCVVSVRLLAQSNIVTTFYKNHAELWLEGTLIGGAIIDDAKSLYRLRFLEAP